MVEFFFPPPAASTRNLPASSRTRFFQKFIDALSMRHLTTHMPQRLTPQELSKQIKCLERELFNAKVHYEIFQGIADVWAEHVRATQHSPVFWQYTMDAHISTTVIRLCRVYDSNRQAIRISQFLSDVE